MLAYLSATPAASRTRRLALCLALAASLLPAARSAEPALPIADAHVHMLAWMDTGELAARMERHGIRWAGGVGGPQHERAIAALGSRYIRPTGMGWWLRLHGKLAPAEFANPDSAPMREALAAIEADLRDRGARVIGEIHVNASTSSPEAAVRFKLPADSAALKALLALAGKYGRPLNIHAQWDADTAQQVERLAASSPGARLMLSHCGSFADAVAIRAAFERQPNLVCDLSARSVPPLHGRGTEFAVFDERSLRREWRQLIEDYPDRFVVGTDIPQDWQDYDAVVRAIRNGLLAHLKPATAEQVAYRNAQRWFGLE